MDAVLGSVLGGDGGGVEVLVGGLPHSSVTWGWAGLVILPVMGQG